MKPWINYLDLAPPLVIGHAARLILMDHKWYRTTPVERVAHGPTGPIIETRNSVYWPADTDESLPAASLPARVQTLLPVKTNHASNSKWRNPFN